MKRSSTGALALLVFLLCLHLPVRAEPPGVQTETPSSSVDAVIVMDQSKSMRGATNMENDPNDYRLDAAQMMIGMADTGSRVAFVPFAREVLPYGDDDFVDLDDTNARNKKLTEIESQRGKPLTPDTDLGVALTKAVRLLLERTEKENSPMIVVLTDGQNDIKDENGKYAAKAVDQWDESAQRFVEVKIPSYNKENADELMYSAAGVAQRYGIPIYAIALKNSAADQDDVKAYEDKLRYISNITGGDIWTVESRDASQLPKYFGEMFAMRIGSRLMQELRIEPVAGSSGRYKVELPILNQSVQEANIIIPLQGIRKSRGGDPAVWLFTPDNADVSKGGTDAYQLKSEYFMLYKISRPRTIGDWRLEFELADDRSSPADITFSLLYNYDIELKVRAGRDPAAMVGEGGSLTLRKDETLRVEALFYGSDGNPSNDKALYNTQANAEWKVIRAAYELIDTSDGRVRAGGPMPVDRGRFTAEIDLKTAYLTPEGHNQLREGEYRLRVAAEGAGLRQVKELPVAILNNAPEARLSTLTVRVVVDDPSKEETQKVQTFEISLSGNVSDPDNDRLTFGRLIPQGETGQVIAMELMTRPDGEVVAVGQTLLDEDGKLFKSGTARYAIQVSDAEGAVKDLQLEVKVQSTAREILDKYVCETEVTGLISNDEAEKNSPVTFRMRLLEQKEGTPDRTGAIRDFRGVLYLSDADTGASLAEGIDFVQAETGDLVAVWETPNESVHVLARCFYEYGHANQAAGEGYEKQFRVNNRPPQAVQGAMDALPERVTFDPLPDSLRFLETPTPPEALLIRLSELFTDADNEKGLVLKDPLLSHRDESVNPDTIMTFTRDGDTVQLVPRGAGTLTLTFAAEDGDREEALAEIIVRVESVNARWQRYGLLALIALVSLIILVILLRQARKPKYPHDGLLLIKENDSIFPSERYELVPTKKRIPLSHVVDEALAQKYGISEALLANLLLRPVRGAGGSIAVSMRGKPEKLVAELDGSALGRKPAIWERDHELILRAAGNMNCLKIQFTREQSEADVGGGFDAEAGFAGKKAKPEAPFFGTAEDDGNF